MGVESSKILLIHKEKGQIINPNETPSTCDLKDGDSLLVVYYKESLHMYSALAQIGKSAQPPNKIVTGPIEEDFPPPVLRGILYFLEKSFLHHKGAQFFRKKDLSGKVFRGEQLAFSNFSGARLWGTDFSCANLVYSDFSFANLRGADFRGADLRNVCFLYANLMLISYDDTTRWENANLAHTVGLHPKEIKQLESKGAIIKPTLIQRDIASDRFSLLFTILFLLTNFGIFYLSVSLAMSVAIGVIPEATNLFMEIARFIIGILTWFIIIIVLGLIWFDFIFSLEIIFFNIRRILKAVKYKHIKKHD